MELTEKVLEDICKKVANYMTTSNGYTFDEGTWEEMKKDESYKEVIIPMIKITIETYLELLNA